MKSNKNIETLNNNLLILACSQRKKEGRRSAPALHLYDGVNYYVLRKFLLELGWPPGLQIKILSAKYGLIDATTIIEPYDKRLDKKTALKLNQAVLDELSKIPAPSSIFINLGKDYLPALDGLEKIFPNSKIAFAKGGIGMKMKAMKKWLKGLHCRNAKIKGYPKKGQPYLYFFPDWDDFIYEPFDSDDDKSNKGVRTYAYELCGDKSPFDGVLLSLAHIHVGKGALHRYGNKTGERVPLRKSLRIPKKLFLFGDCGAFSYANEQNPLFTPEQAAALYHKFGFDIGASVDHIPLPEIMVRQPDGSLKRRLLSESEREERMYLTRDYAQRFISDCREKKYGFVPLGVIQGLGVQSYVDRLYEYIEMGYSHIALGGLVPRSDSDILDIVCAIRKALQTETRGRRENIWVHLFGILRPKLQPIFKELGVSSFDSASYFRKAWLRSNQNYIAPHGHSWYGTIRVPISSSKPMQAAAISQGLSNVDLLKMESDCLSAIENCNQKPTAAKLVIESINKYGPLLVRKGEENHFAEKHALLLKDRPWEKCACPFCKSAGIHVVVFRGASRNKRRGLHNTWVFYHKVLHGKSVPTFATEKE